MRFARHATLTIIGALSLLVLAGACTGTVSGSGGGNTGGSTTSSGVGGAGGDIDLSFSACDAPGQCVLAATGCCGTCGMPELGDVAAVNQMFLSQYQHSVCPEPVPCPACASENNPNLYATCESGHCKAWDARQSPVSACTQDSDCILRYGMACCESTCQGADADLTCVSATGFQAVFNAMACQGVGCDKCLPGYPMDAKPLCGQDGHCYVGLIN